MSDTKIEWAEKSWNPVTGCSHAGSPGCDHCYARRMAVRLAANPKVEHRERYDGFKVSLWPERLTEPLKWRKPKRVFVCSMGDLFHPGVPFEIVDDVVRIVRMTERHIFLMLTKRPQIMAEYFDTWNGRVKNGNWPTRNLWLGVTVEMPDQLWRVDKLLQIPAAVRFVSYEPALAPVDLSPYLPIRCCSGHECGCMGLPINPPPYLDWVISGCETGSGARPMSPDWARSLRDQCQEAGVPFFLKKLTPQGDRELDGNIWEEFPI